MLLSCKGDKKFDAEVWKKEAFFYDFRHRSAMAEDLVKNYPLKSKSYAQIDSLLGKPQDVSRFPEREVFYTRYVLEAESDRFGVYSPVTTKRLVFEFGKDSLVKSCTIEDTRYLLDDF
ncbi:hypothetical protein [Chryseobacterium sp. FH2]|uniref:hypothetical protein n=1 Tax=Chryseobacterium sp. FH2 TaxID=1674291 RepID=UPI00103E01A4|nr:hypothetical protein [Chryseobacterium sp. FH2]